MRVAPTSKLATRMQVRTMCKGWFMVQSVVQMKVQTSL